jgi:outer membrane receptor protein involved in Fe transport
VTYSGISPKLGVRAQVGADAQVFANISRSLEPPSFGELTGGPGVTQVDMQEATTLEVGTRVQRAQGGSTRRCIARASMVSCLRSTMRTAIRSAR